MRSFLPEFIINMRQAMVELEIKPTAGMRLGVLTLVALAVALGSVLIFLLTGGGREFFERTAPLTTYMPDGTGVAPGSEVRLSGIGIGHVTAVDISGSLDPQRVVRVDMTVNARFLKSIPSDSQTSIGADTLVGYRFIDIAEGKSPIPVPEAGELKSEPVRQASDRADLVLSLQKELQQVDRILEQLGSQDTAIGQFLLGEKEYDLILARLTGFQSGIRGFADSAAGKALFSDAMYRSLREPLLQVDATLTSMQKSQLFASDEQYNKVLTQLKQLHASIAGVSGKLKGQAQYDRVLKLLHDTDRMILTMTVGESATARLLNNVPLYESLYGSARSIEALLRDFRENPQKYMRYQVFNKNKKK